MRLAIVSDLTKWSWAGCEELWAALARSALLRGHKVCLFLPRNDAPQNKLRPLEEAGLRVYRPGLGARMVATVRRRVSFKLASVVASGFQLFGKLDSFAPDVVLINSGDTFPDAVFLNEIKRSGALRHPYVIICHNSFLFGRPAAKAAREAAASYYREARRVLFVASRTRLEAEHLLAAKLPQARIVRNPVNMTDLTAMEMPVTATVGLACVGRVATNSKGQDILLAALGSTEIRSLDWRLSIYGRGPDVDYLKALAQHYRIAEKVTFKGQTDDVRAIWAENHLLVLPSHVESAPLCLVEAMLCGRPAVVTDVGGVLEWAAEPETAFVSHGIHIEGFRAALERAWSARAAWHTIGLRAREKALGMLDPDPGGTVLKIIEEVHAESSVASAIA